MNVKAKSSHLFKTLRSFGWKSFFLLCIIGSSITPYVAFPTSVPFKTELHEKSHHRVSKQTLAYGAISAVSKDRINPSFEAILASTSARILHCLKIARKEKSNFHNQNGIHLRVPQPSDAPSGHA